MVNIISLFTLEVLEYDDGSGHVVRYDVDGHNEIFSGSMPLTKAQVKTLKEVIPGGKATFEVVTYDGDQNGPQEAQEKL